MKSCIHIAILNPNPATIRIELDGTPDQLRAMQNVFRDWLCSILGCPKPKPRSRGFRLLTVEPDEPLPKGSPMRVDLQNPIKPGFRRPISLTPDEALDARADGSFAAVETVEGDSTASVRTESTADQVKLYLNGDGALGNKVVRVKADGHVGPGEAEITLDIGYTVAHPDATAFGPVVEEIDEPIPAPA